MNTNVIGLAVVTASTMNAQANVQQMYIGVLFVPRDSQILVENNAVTVIPAKDSFAFMDYWSMLFNMPDGFGGSCCNNTCVPRNIGVRCDFYDGSKALGGEGGGMRWGRGNCL